MAPDTDRALRGNKEGAKVSRRLNGSTSAQPDHCQRLMHHSLALPDDKVHVRHTHYDAHNADWATLEPAYTQEMLMGRSGDINMHDGRSQWAGQEKLMDRTGEVSDKENCNEAIGCDLASDAALAKKLLVKPCNVILHMRLHWQRNLNIDI